MIVRKAGFVLLLHFALLLNLIRENRGAKFFRNDYEYHHSLNGWTKYHRMPATWEEARLRCFYEGSILLSPINQELMAEMRRIMQNNVLPIFTGFSSTHFNGDYYSIEGISLERIVPQWAADEPNNPGNEQCIAMYSNGLLADVQCNIPLPYFCYKRNTEKLGLITACGTVDPEYQYDARTGHCYKVHKNTQTWPRAFLACSAEGGYLAIINSDKEARVLKELMAKNPGSKIRGAQRDIFSIGIRDWSQHGVFMTIHGVTPAEAGYNIWAAGQPDNAETGEHCGSVFRDAKLNDVWCDVPGPFICEKLPESLVDCGIGRTCDIEPKLKN